MHHLLIQNKLVTDIEKKNIEYCRKSATSQITEGSQRYPFSKKRKIEKINDIQNYGSHTLSNAGKSTGFKSD